MWRILKKRLTRAGVGFVDIVKRTLDHRVGITARFAKTVITRTRTEMITDLNYRCILLLKQLDLEIYLNQRTIYLTIKSLADKERAGRLLDRQAEESSGETQVSEHVAGRDVRCPGPMPLRVSRLGSVQSTFGKIFIHHLDDAVAS